MTRPEQPQQPSSIFSTPDPHEEPVRPISPAPEQPAQNPLDAATSGASYPQPPSRLPPPSRAARRPSRRTLAIGAAIGGGAIVGLSFLAFTLLWNDDPPAVTGGGATFTASPTRTAEPSVDAPRETSSPEPTPEPTPQPTPTGPPIELAVGDWATVTTDELVVRAAAGAGQDSVYTLVRGAVVTVAEGPRPVNARNWYRIASLGGATGWVTSGFAAEPNLDTILNDPVLIRCGEVANPVFDIVNGAPVAREVLRVGDFAVPANKLDESVLAAIELARGVGDEVCLTAQVGSDGLPFLRSEPRVTACGHAVAEGQGFWLRPAANQEADVSTQIKDPALVHPVLLAGPADHREASNLRTLMTMMTNDGAAGCVGANINDDADGLQSFRNASVEQCSIVSEYNDGSIKLRPASGGSTAWIKLPHDGSSRDDIPLDIPIEVYVSTDVNPDGIWSYAWSSYSWEGEECA